jgi:hypothetical protein
MATTISAIRQSPNGRAAARPYRQKVGRRRRAAISTNNHSGLEPLTCEKSKYSVQSASGFRVHPTAGSAGVPAGASGTPSRPAASAGNAARTGKTPNASPVTVFHPTSIGTTNSFLNGGKRLKWPRKNA